MSAGSAVLAFSIAGLTACDRAEAAGNSGRTPASVATAQTAAQASDASSEIAPSPTADTLSDSALLAVADRSRLLGRDSGTMWLVMISDFQCPYCKQWHDSSMAAVKRDYISTGKVRMAYLNLPLSNHPHARAEAEASLCAGAQGKFWEFSEALFRDQKSVNASADVKPYLNELARSQSLDIPEFARCRKSKAIAALINSDQAQASRAGVSSTPSFLIGDFLVEGALPYADFRRAIDTALFTARSKRTR